MNKRIAMALLLGTCVPLANAEVVELAPDLYMVIRTTRAVDTVAVKIGAISEANEFAAKSGRVAVPVTSRLTMLGTMLKEYDYQFRVMTRADALAAKPVLADVVVAVGTNSCGEQAARQVAAMMPDLSNRTELRDRDLLAANDPNAADEDLRLAAASVPEAPANPGLSVAIEPSVQ
ncbi:MAG: hypothetical protein ABI769_09705 [Pseudomonadota bacterium]